MTALDAAPVPLRRTRPAPPVRHVHVGLGNFFRAHQAWYTHRAPDGDQWGIAAFTGRSPHLADALHEQDGLFTLDTRGADGDHFEVITSVAATHPARDHGAWLRYLADPQVVLVSLTVTEAGYSRGPDGGLAGTDRVAADLAALLADPSALVSTVPFRLVAGLAARRAGGAGPLTVVPCDNLPDNGAATARVVREAARLVDPALAGWIDDNVSYVTTMVDRITPEPTDGDVTSVAIATGVLDSSPVVTEPFSEWVLSGSFRAGRPRWEAAGATFTDDVRPFEARKLGLLNGAHSLLAYGGLLRGHTTVADAVGDQVCLAWVEQWWDEASAHLAAPADGIAAYRTALLARFRNPAIRHRLDQIAADGSQKLPVRIVPTVRAERAAGRLAQGGARVLAAWILHLRAGASVTDVRAAELVGLAAGGLDEAVPRVLGELDPELAEDAGLVAAVLSEAGRIDRA
ncbi:mannitol dehydrogenase family protein [Promicromonospora vindobonensis]|uniref:Mannitol dehydrogenase family protein n=1 Tax=Promicromonospora vindobonensis TaxID=195748 RepID=A0ABW5VK18_9MICO